MSFLLLSRQPNEADEIVGAVFLIVRIEEEDGDDNDSDIDEVGVGW